MLENNRINKDTPVTQKISSGVNREIDGEPNALLRAINEITDDLVKQGMPWSEVISKVEERMAKVIAKRKDSQQTNNLE